MAATDRAVWLIDGDDAILLSEARRALVDELVGDADRSMVVEEYSDEALELGAVVDACQTPPFLADRRVVVLTDVGRWSTEELAPLLAYLEEPLPTTSLVLVAGGGRLAPKLVAAVKAHGHLTGTGVSSREAKSWVRDRVHHSGVRLDAAAEQMLEAHLGEDVSRLSAILDVLVAAHGRGAHLSPADVEPYLGQAGSVVPWELTDAIDDGRIPDALRLLHRLLEAGERHPLVVLSILHRHVAGMLRIDGPGITTEAAAAAAMGIAKGRSTFPAKKALTSARRYGPDGVAQAMAWIAAAELDLKGRSAWSGELVLDVLVARLGRLARAGRGGSARRPAGRR